MTSILRLVILLGLTFSGGCAALTNPVADGVPVNRLPSEVLGRPKAELRAIPLTLLRQKEPEIYRLDKGDVLAVVADDVLGPANQQPPIRLPDPQNDTAAIGYPVPVGDDGTISIPRLPPMQVKGKSLREVEVMLRDAITGKSGGKELVKPEAARVSVQLLQKRRYQIMVVREDTLPVSFQGQLNAPVLGGTKRGAGFTINLQAGENDVLRALNATGGPPGLDARNEVVILRGRANGSDATDQAVRIPLRIYPDQPLTIREDDVILRDGDIVKIEARDTEVYYTAGLIGGGQYALPRDYDLDVIQTIAQVRDPIINCSFTQNAFVAQAVNTGIGYPNPSLCTVLRRLPDGRQVPIRVDLNKAFRDPRERILIHAGDIIVLQERPGEAIARYLTQLIRFSAVLDAVNGNNTGNTSINGP